MLAYIKHTLKWLMTNMLTTGKSDINYTGFNILLNRTESDKNDGVHVILKPSKLYWHNNLDMPPDMQLFNIKNVSGTYKIVNQGEDSLLRAH